MSNTNPGPSVTTTTNLEALLVNSLGSAGQVLTSNGATTAPTWTTVSGTGTVTHTGTLTAHAVMLGNAGADITAVGSLGSAGQVLTSNGAGADPSWQAGGGGGGSGTVTSVSVTTANGVSGSVATATTTPAISLTLGAITPSSVNGNTITTGTGTLTLAASSTLATSGANSITLTSTGSTNVTLPTSGTLMTNPMTTGGDIIYGGASGVPTRLANGTTGQALLSTGTTTAPAWTTLPGGGDALTSNPLSQFAATTSAQLAGVITNETGTGVLVFNTSPTLITPDLGTPSAGVATNLTGTAAGLTAGIANGLKSATTTVSVSAATAPTNGQVLTATAGTTATWQTPSGLTNPMTTGGDIIYGGASGVPTRLANGTSGQLLQSSGSTTAPVWATVAGGTVPTGTGFYHITGGVADGAAAAVNLASADVTGVIPTATNAQTGTTYTIAANDQGKLVTLSNASSIAVTLPQATGSFGTGWTVTVQNKGAGTATITPSTSNIDGASTLVLGTNQGVCLVSDGTNYSTFRGLASGAGSGSVTTVSVVTANGVSGSVANPTSTPAITLTLGAITPTSVNGNTITTGTGVLTLAASKTLTASNTVTLTGTDGVSMNLTNNKLAQITGFLDGGGAQVINGSSTICVPAAFAGTITAYTITVDTGTCTIKTWKKATGTAIPTVSDSISTSGVAISSGTVIRSTSLTDFTTTTVAANDLFIFNITAISSATKISFTLEITKT